MIDDPAQLASYFELTGRLPPWSVAPPLPGLLSAFAFADELSVVRAALICLSGICAFAFFRGRWAISFGVAGALIWAFFLLQISRWEIGGSVVALCFWSFVPAGWLTLDRYLSSKTTVRLAWLLLAGAAAVLSRAVTVERSDVLGLLLLAGLLFLSQVKDRWLAVAGCACGAALVLALPVQWATPYAYRGGQEAVIFEPRREPWALEHALHAQAIELITSKERPRESVLWLRALGADLLLARCRGKWRGRLEASPFRRRDWCMFDSPAPALRAVRVSRQRFEDLPAVRSLFDVEALEAYVFWAERPEAVGVRSGLYGVTPFFIEADLGRDDVILLREPWHEALVGERKTDDGWTPVELRADPIGYIVIDAEMTGAVELRVSSDGDRWSFPTTDQLGRGMYPIIQRGGIAEARSFSPGPFAPQAYLAVFGERFCPTQSDVILDGEATPALFSSATQINFRLPVGMDSGAHEIRARCNGLESLPTTFEVRSP